MLRPGLAVMVAVGRAAAAENASPSVICYAEVVGRAPDGGPFHPAPGGLWLLDLHVALGTVLRGQTYRADEILGVPALGLAMPDLKVGA